jgi:predicted HTH transcriptional regulator
MVMEKELTELDITGFKKMFKEKTQEELDLQTLRKLDLVKTEQEREYPTRALVLFADDELRRSLFPYAKIECARFKGTTVDEFIDQKTIDCQLGLQAEEAYNFVLRHINKGAKVEGVYTIYRWEYPIKAIREIIRNAVVHRQYSLTGKDIKIAIYDDMVEITSPGLLPPSIDYSAMNSRQSDARNKVIAGVFKHLGIIDQWGNGLKLVAEEMKQYPHIELKWREVGLSFQVQFVNKAFGGDVGDVGGGNVGDVGDAETLSKVLQLIKDNAIISASEIADILKLSRRQCERVIAKLKKRGILEREGNTRTGRWIIRQA